ncbi:MAG: hypothetical protein IKG18_01980 [Atopobiaceae bacterium]|nr:hypothetical protein [Atopobiaceae bacterium]
MVNNGLTGFERAVEDALDRLGTGLLGRPQEFTGAVADLYDPDSPEMAVLYMHCSGELLHLYDEAAREGARGSLELAARKAERLLRDVKFVNEGVSSSVAWGIARGVAAHLGVGLPQNPDDVRAGEDEAARAALERARSVMADPSATEADVAVALAELRALPSDVQGKAGMEAALDGRLARLVAERETEETCRAKEARKRREAEERARAEAARRRQEERDRPLAEREAKRKVTTDAEPAPAPKPGNRVVAAALAAVACVVVAVVLFANSHNETGAGSSGAQSTVAQSTVAQSTATETKAQSTVAQSTTTETKARANEGSVPGVKVRKGVAKYSWEELKEVSGAIAAAKSDKAGLDIAEEYHLVDSDGRLQGDTKDVTLTDGTKTSVRILGFRHDELVGGGLSGISFEFADAPKAHCMNAEDTNEGGWEASEMRAWLNSDFWELLPKDLRSCIEPASKRTNNVGGDTGEDASAVSATTDKLWLLAQIEVSDLGYGAAEGSQYKLYEEDEGAHYSFKSGAEYVWLRSPRWQRDDEYNNPNGLPLARFEADWGDHRSDNFEFNVEAVEELPSTFNGVSPGFCL